MATCGGPDVMAGRHAAWGNSSSGGSAAGGAAGVPKCGTGTPVLAGGKDSGFSKCADGMTVHRTKVVECPDLRVEASPGSCSASARCRSNADCTSVAHGVCETGLCLCFPACNTDADCGTGKICQCDTMSGTCVEARCTSDADCGSGLVCALSLSQRFFACQTPADMCLGKLDCGACGQSCPVRADGHRACAFTGGCESGTGGGGH